MNAFVALLRGVNVGGRNRIAMGDLRDMCDELGLAGARTLLQSGNVVFRSATAPAKLVRMLQAKTAQRFGIDVDYIVRTADAWAALVAANPFPEEALRDPGHLVVMCCSGAPDAAGVALLESSIVGRERVRVAGRDVYIVYPDGISDSRFTNALIEKRLGLRGTARNWNTVRKLAELVRSINGV